MAKLMATAVEGSQLVRWWAEGGSVVVTREDLDRGEILRLNQELRQRKQRTDGMKMALSIPPDDLVVIKRLYPDLASPDAEIRHKGWKAFMASSFSEPYRVYEPSRRGATA